MSQRALGLLFNPPVTTQFISNVERGVTPLPPIHVPVLAKALEISESEIMALLEREYALKLNGRLGKPVDEIVQNGAAPGLMPGLAVAGPDYDFMKSVFDAYRGADMNTRQAFATVCENILKVSKPSHSSSSSSAANSE
jgi:hypothetical protein